MSSALDSVPAFTDRASKMESNVGSLTNWLRKSLQLLVVWPLLSPTLRKQQIYLVLGKPWALYIRHQEYILYIYILTQCHATLCPKTLVVQPCCHLPLEGFFHFPLFSLNHSPKFKNHFASFISPKRKTCCKKLTVISLAR